METRRMKIRTSDFLFDSVNVLLLIVVSFICIFPIIHVFGMSFASLEDQVTRKIIILPKQWDMFAYSFILSNKAFFTSLKNSVIITVLGTIVNLAFTCTMAYGVSRKTFAPRRAIMLLVLFTLVFNGGLIPTYLVVKATGLLNTYWSMIIPGAISAFYLIILREFFSTIPEEINESAKIDGLNDMQIFVRIALPLSLPALATFTLFYAVGHWNQFFTAIMYNHDSSLWPLQVLLRQIVLQGSNLFDLPDPNLPEPPEDSVRSAIILLTAAPIVVLYPFLQKYFVKGLTLGSVKG